MILEEKNINSFFQCPFDIYGNDIHYVSPLKSDLKRYLDLDKNPLFKNFGKGTYFTVREGKEVVGRIVAHVHQSSNECHELNRSYFGYFDCENNQEVANLLLNAAQDWGRAQGCNEIAGNFNLTAMQEMGVTTGGYENPPYIDQLYSPAHIQALLTAHGYEPFFPMTTFELSLDDIDSNLLIKPKTKELMTDPCLMIKDINRRHFTARMEDACTTLNKGFAKNPFFVPLTLDEFWFHAKDLYWVLDPKISKVAYYNDKPAGVVLCIPDVNSLLKSMRSKLSITAPLHFAKYRFNRKRALVVYYSVDPEFQGMGINTLLLHDVINNLKKNGYEKLGITWISDQNIPSLRQMEKLHAKELHKLHLFKKAL